MFLLFLRILNRQAIYIQGRTPCRIAPLLALHPVYILAAASRLCVCVLLAYHISSISPRLSPTVQLSFVNKYTVHRIIFQASDFGYLFLHVSLTRGQVKQLIGSIMATNKALQELSLAQSLTQKAYKNSHFKSVSAKHSLRFSMVCMYFYAAL